MINFKVNINGADLFISDYHPKPESTSELKVSPKLKADLIELLNLKEPDVPNKITWEKFVEMYNAAALRNPLWIALTDRNKDVNKRFLTARKLYPTIEEWEVIIGAMEKDPFYSGKSGIYDRPKALTLFRDQRFNEFYEAGIHAKNGPKKETIDDILDDFRERKKKIREKMGLAQ